MVLSTAYLLLLVTAGLTARLLSMPKAKRVKVPARSVRQGSRPAQD